jgi:hypothetical protein
METIRFNISINAGKQKVYDTMIADATYREWTKAFHEGSFYSGSWDKGSEIHFLGPSEDGKLGGMYSRIAENIPGEFISIQHLGMINDGVIDTTSEEVKKWAPSFENYTFTGDGNSTDLKVEMQTPKEYKATFEEMWPRALQLLKTLAEK